MSVLWSVMMHVNALNIHIYAINVDPRSSELGELDIKFILSFGRVQ